MNVSVSDETLVKSQLDKPLNVSWIIFLGSQAFSR